MIRPPIDSWLDSVAVLSLLFMMGCTLDTDTAAEQKALRMTERLERGEVRAGMVVDAEALFGGVSAEGAVGDIKVYNDRAQFIIQAPGTSHYYVEAGGSVIDADIVRPFGQPGQDLIDESSAMVGLGRMFHADTVEVVNDGTNGEAAVVRATGGVGPLALLSGSLESFGLILNRKVEVTNEYTLEPDSWLLKTTTHIRWNDQPTQVQLADLAFVATDVADFYEPNVGYQTNDFQETFGWTGVVGQRNEGAMAFLQGEEDEHYTSSVLLDTLLDLGPLLMGPGPIVTMNEGDELEWSRYLGVGPDMASITGEWLTRHGKETQTIGGTALANDKPVSGARVHVQDEMGGVITMAIANEEGQYSAKVPASQPATVIAESRGPGIYFDRKPGAGWYSPYAADIPRARTISSIASGSLPIPFSPGHGIGTPQAAGANIPLQLNPPGQLHVVVEDGGPATVRVEFAAEDPVIADPMTTPARPSGHHAWLYIRDGQASIPLEPGKYRVVVHRGLAHEAHVEEIEVKSGGQASIEAHIVQSVNTEGLWSFDPHTHAAPSADGSISMTGRLTVHAAHGVDIHVGTDHDHVADYRVLLQPLGLQNHLASVVADEVSPIRRGHHNVYPLEVDPNKMNGGATRWYDDWVDLENTDDFYASMRTMKSDGDVIVQANHPTSRSGLFANANYSAETGEIGTASRWSSTFDSFELLNDGGYKSVFPYYLDMLNRGMNPTPVGVSDSHSHRGGVGENLTWLPIEMDDIRALNNDHIRAAVREGGTVVSHGPLVVATIDGEWAPGTSHVGSVDVNVEIRTPSWMMVNTLRVYENGTEILTLDATANPLEVSLAPETDAVYVFVVEGNEDMSPVYPGRLPWAATQAFHIDADGNGWQPSLPPLTLR